MPRSTMKPLLPFKTADRWFALPVDSVEGVAPLPTVVPFPGNRSRAIRGLSYLFGQLMATVDIAPFMNLGNGSGRMVVVVKQGSAYYAFVASEIDQLMTRPTIVAYKRPLFDFTTHYVDHKGRKISIISVERLIDAHICR